MLRLSSCEPGEFSVISQGVSRNVFSARRKRELNLLGENMLMCQFSLKFWCHGGSLRIYVTIFFYKLLVVLRF